MQQIRRSLTIPVLCVAALAPVSAAQAAVPQIARGKFDARLGIPGTKTIYHRRWTLSPSCLGATCPTIRLRMQRPDNRYDAVTLRRASGVYRGSLQTRAVCRGRLATRSGTISLALRVTRTVQRELVSGRKSIITNIGGELRVRSATGVCPPRRHMGKMIRTTADRTDLPAELVPDFNVMPQVPSVTAGTNTVQFSDLSAPSQEIVSRSWDFGDPGSGSANKGTGTEASHTYARAGNYLVRITVVDRYGQVASDVGSVDVVP